MPEFTPIKLLRQHLKDQGLPLYTGESLSHTYGASGLKLLQDYSEQNWAKGGQIPQLLANIGAEYLLLTNNRPYFKIYPEFVAPLVDTQLDVPTEYCKLPYVSFEIRLPRESPVRLNISRDLEGRASKLAVGEMDVLAFLVYEEQPALAAIIEAMDDFARAYRPDTLELVKVGREFADIKAKSNREKHIISVIGLALNWAPPAGTINVRSISVVYPLAEAMTLEESAAHFTKKQHDVPHNILQETGDALRLALAVSFLATNHDLLIEADVLSKDLAKFCHPDTDEETRKKLHNRAASRRGGEGRGYTLGRRERLLRVAQERNDEVAGDETGTPLKYQHQRRGHIHRFHTKTKMIYKWIPQLTVKPDLPVDTDREGSGTVIK